MSDQKDQKATVPQEVSDYYEMGRESGRLSSGAEGELEFVRTQEIIRRYFLGPPAVILDVGGGPGAYALWLAGEGYEVHLVDPVPLHLEQAEVTSQDQPGLPIHSIILGDARSLAQPDGYADIVLLLGPLYHLIERADRITALKEAHRVLKPGGILFAAGISRFASTLAGLIEKFFDDPNFVAIVQRDLAEGQHRNPTKISHYFTTAFFHHPDELRQEVEEAGFEIKEILAVEGIAVFLQDLNEQWSDPAHRQRILDAVRWLETEPSVLGITSHIIAVGVKR